MGFADAAGVPLSQAEYTEGVETVWGRRMAAFLAGIGGAQQPRPGLGQLSPETVEPADQAPRRDRKPTVRGGPSKYSLPWPSSSDSRSSIRPALLALSPTGATWRAHGGDDGAEESVLVLETLGAPAPPLETPATAASVEAPAPPATAAAGPGHGGAGLRALRAETRRRPLAGRERSEGGTVDALVAEAIGLLNRALHAHATASADPHASELSPERAVAVRIGYGSGEQVAAGRFAAAREVDVWDDWACRGAARRAEDLRPQERIAAVLGGRERIDACETLLLRARADLDAGRSREAALQLRVGLEALLAELAGAVLDPGHDEDMAALHERRARGGRGGERGAEGRAGRGCRAVERARAAGDLRAGAAAPPGPARLTIP